MKRFLSVLLVLAILGAGGYYGYQYYQHNTAAPAAAIQQPAYTSDK